MNQPALVCRATTFSAATPVLIVALLAPDAASLVAEARRAASAGAGCLECRVDHLTDWADPAAIADAVAQLREAAGDLPLIGTLRTEAEGGEAAASDDDYLAVVEALVAEGVDLVDVEVARATAPRAIAAAHAGGVRVVGSRHEFDRTPPEDEIVAALARAEAMGADIAKVAVMPDDDLDTLTLLRATARRSASAGVPLLTIAMGRPGVASRLVGGLFGSCATFVTVPDATGPGRPSAPGQAPLPLVRDALAALRRAVDA